MFPENDYLFPPMPESSRLLIGCRREDFSASRIAHAVEDCNAHLINLNVTTTALRPSAANAAGVAEASDAKFPIVVDLRVNHRNPESIKRSLERYGYTILDTFRSDDSDDVTARDRIANLIRYLEI